MKQMIRKQTKIWTTKDKRKIRICDMADQHLINTTKMLERYADIYTQISLSKAYEAESCLQGEMALESIDNVIQDLEENGVAPERISPLYSNFIKEKLRRGL